MNFINQLLENLKGMKSILYLGRQEVILLIHKQIKFLLCVIDLFSKHACVVFLKDEGITNVNAFQSILNN